MIKTKNSRIYSPLVTAGYILFGLLIVAVLFSTVIPYSTMLLTPGVLYQNVILIAIAFIIGSLLPVILGYMIGDNSLKSKNRISHHFNGVLFGLLAYWVMMIVSTVISYPADFLRDEVALRMLIVNIVPSIGVLFVTVVIALAHIRGKQAKRDVIEYAPYGYVLVGSVAFLPLWSLLQNIVTQNIGWYSLLPLAMIIVLWLFSYISLRNSKLKTFSKAVWSVVSVSIAFIAVYVAAQLTTWIGIYIDSTSSAAYQSAVSSIGFVAGLIGWAVYWSAQVRTLRKK